MAEQVIHNEFDGAMKHVNEVLAEMNPRRRFVVVVIEDIGDGVAIKRTSWNFRVAKYREALNALRDNFINDIIPPMPEPLPTAEEDWMEECRPLDENLDKEMAEKAGCDIPSSPEFEQAESSNASS